MEVSGGSGLVELRFEPLRGIDGKKLARSWQPEPEQESKSEAQSRLSARKLSAIIAASSSQQLTSQLIAVHREILVLEALTPTTVTHQHPLMNYQLPKFQL